MRLAEVERGETAFRRLLIRFISTASGMRLPDIVRVVWYKKAFFGAPMSAWTQFAMRGPSAWTIAERELMAASVAEWNNCRFCAVAHRTVAGKVVSPTMVDAVLDDFRGAGISPQLRATLAFLEKLTLSPDALTSGDARQVMDAGVAAAALRDAIAVASIFATVTRYADALDFAVPAPHEMDQAAARLLKKGYAA